MSKSGQYNSPFKAVFKGISDLYGKKKNGVALDREIDLSGKIVMITGSSSGLGLATAQRLAYFGAEIIMPVRSGIPEKGEEVKRSSGNENVRMYPLDLSDFDSIDQLVATLKSEGVKIDILISNAAVVTLSSRKTKYDLDEMFMVNYLAPRYLITQLLKQGLIYDQEDRKGRVIIVSSESHRNAESFNWDDFGTYKDFGVNHSVAHYGYTKLLLTTFAATMARRLQEQSSNVCVKALCPGPVNTNIAREAPAVMKPLLRMAFSLFFKSPEKACDPIIYFATHSRDAQYEQIPYLFLMQAVDIDPKAADLENGERLWIKSEELQQRMGLNMTEVKD